MAVAKIFRFGKRHTVSQVIADAVSNQAQFKDILFIAIRPDGDVLTSWSEGDKLPMLGALRLLETDLIEGILGAPRELLDDD